MIVIPDIVKIKVCQLVVTRIGSEANLPVYGPKDLKTYGTIEYNWQDLGTKKLYGNVWFDLWKKYDEEKKRTTLVKNLPFT